MKLSVTVLLFSILIPMISFSQSVNQFRGASRDGFFQSKNLLKKWPADGLKVIWKNDSVGNGYGSAVIAGSQILINGEVDSTGYLYCLGLNGKLKWKVPYGKEWIYTFPGSRSTPTVEGDLVYVTSGMGNMNCFNLKDGSKSWSISMRKQLHGRYTYHGHAESPLLVDDKVIIVAGGKDTNVVALNRFSGAIEWICKGKGEIPGYNSPILIQLPGRKIIVTFSAYHLLGIDASNGELLWSHEQMNTAPEERKPGIGDTHSNSAYYKDGFIYYIAGDGNGAVKLKLSEDGKTITQVWRNPAIDNYMGGFILLDDKIYTASDSKKSLLTLDPKTGEILDSLKVGCGVTFWADDLLYYYNQRGEVKLIRPAGKAEVISSMKVAYGFKEHFSLPVIENGILYIRHGKSLIAYSIQQQ